MKNNGDGSPFIISGGDETFQETVDRINKMLKERDPTLLGFVLIKIFREKTCNVVVKLPLREKDLPHAIIELLRIIADDLSGE